MAVLLFVALQHCLRKGVPLSHIFHSSTETVFGYVVCCFCQHIAHLRRPPTLFVTCLQRETDRWSLHFVSLNSEILLQFNEQADGIIWSISPAQLLLYPLL